MRDATDPLLREILYEIAMSIGIGLDTQAMLGACLPIFLRRLGGAAVCVLEHQAGPDGAHFTVLRTLPRNADFREIARRLPEPTGAAPLPSPFASAGDHHHYAWWLPGFGALILTHRHLPEMLAREIGQLTQKLANALLACRDHAQLHAALDAAIAAHHEADRLREHLQVTLTSIGEGVISTDVEGRVTFLNPVAEALTGWTMDAARGRSILEVFRIINETSREEMECPVGRVIREGVVVGLANHTLLIARDGTERPIADSAAPIRHADGRIAGAVLVFRDQTEARATLARLEAREKQLEHIAHYDPLTGLPNRALLADRLTVALAQARRAGVKLAVCYLDLDGFKAINDTHGHAVGDILLREIARRLEANLRGGDTAARIGGDEFVLLLADLSGWDECAAILARTADVLARPVWHEGLALKVTASIGITLYPDDGADGDTLLRHADQALYAAKEDGRNRHHLFDPRHDQAARARRSQLQRLEQALAQGEFVLHYQPQVDMRSGEIIGAEALIRWRHPERGLLPPNEFLPQLAGSELEIRLGQWVIGEALRQMDAWRAQGIDLAVAVNIAPGHLAQADFTECLAGLLAAHPTTPRERLKLEVVESAALEDVAHVAQIIEACRQMGVRFAIDDFGTGYASLAYLRHLPVAMIKIDQGFVRDMLTNPEDQAIIAGIIGMSHAFQVSVLAEGVERTDQADALLTLGCQLVQGFHFGRPVAAEDFARRWLTGA